MNFKKFILLMLIGIVCSVSVVSAADINDSIVESGFDDNPIVIDDLQNDFTVQKMPSLLKSSYGGGPGNAVGGVIKDGGKYPHGGYYPDESGSGSKSRPVGLI